MAEFKTLVPFIMHFEAGVAVYVLKRSFNEIFEVAKRTGFSNDPNDPGGPTMVGVTLGTYNHYRSQKSLLAVGVDQLKDITFEEWIDIAKELFWDSWRADEIQMQSIANIAVDWTWGSGPKIIKLIQRILGVAQDGVVGPKTIEALNKRSSIKFFNQLRQARENYYYTIASHGSKKRYLNGWLKRTHAMNPDGTFNFDIK